MPSMLLAAAGILLVLLSSGDRAEAASGLRLIAPQEGRTVSGKVRFAARVPRGTHRVGFYVDGRRRWVARSRPWRFRRHGRLDTRRLANGRHRLGLRVRRAGGRRQTVHRLIRVDNAKPSKTPRRKRRRTPDPPPPPPPPKAATWTADFEGPSLSDWSHYIRSDGGTFYATGPKPGVTPHTGNGMGHFEVTASQLAAGDDHSKVFKIWALNTPETNGNEQSGSGKHTRIVKGQEAGTYRAWYFLPANYQAHKDWTNVMQWKTAGRAANDPNGDSTWHQTPQWWLNLTRADAWGSSAPTGTSGGDPVLSAMNWHDSRYVYGPSQGGKLRAVPRGRWFEIRTELYPGDRIDVFVDGQFWQALPASVFYVGVGYGHDPNNWTTAYGAGQIDTAWIWGVGHYGGVGSIWVDDASFTTR